MCAQVIGVVRTATRLEALVYDSPARTNPVATDPAHAARPAAPWRRAHVCSFAPLLPAARPALSAAWSRLAAVTCWDPATLDDVLLVLRETVPSLDPPPPLAMLGDDVHPAQPPRATAAHPRAFRGTRHKPPKPPRPAAIDVRPHLLTRRHTDRVLDQLGAKLQMPEPYPGLDARFAIYLLPLLRGASAGTMATAATLAHVLDAYADPELRAVLVGIYLAARSVESALGWWSHLLANTAATRVELAKMIIASGAAASRPPPFDALEATLVDALGPEPRWAIYRAFARGASMGYLRSGLDLRAITPWVGEDLPLGTADVTSIVTAVATVFAALPGDRTAASWQRELWLLCGQLPGFDEVMASPAFRALQPAAATAVVRLAGRMASEPETAERAWCAIGPHLPRIFELAARVAPSHQHKLVAQMTAVCSWAVDNAHDVTDAVAKCIDLAAHLAAPPFGTAPALGWLLPALALVYTGDARQRAAMRAALDAPWLALETACKRDNDAFTLWRGFNRLALYAPDLLVATFSSNPAALIETADRLSSISFEAAAQLLVTFMRSPLADADLAHAPTERLCQVVEPVVLASGPSPIRRALREHLAGDRILTADQLRGHRARVVRGLGVVRLAAVRQAVDRALSARVGLDEIETPTVRHALAMLEGAGANRRALRGMLAAWMAGDRDWTLRHPRTREWFARHPELDRDVWLSGTERRVEIDGLGRVTIAVERDRLEALKLGTYAGTCLGRGGAFQYSAAAIVLDVNKQVIYARDERGEVVARQVVAVSEAGELVCFEVYGAAREPLASAFRELDRAWASKLGIPLFAQRDEFDEYEIARILSQAWRDDDAWAAEPSPEPGTAPVSGS